MPYASLNCSDIVFRAVEKHDHLKTAVPHWRAFRVKKIDTKGLSVSITLDSCGEEFAQPFAGKLSVHVGHVRDILVEECVLNVVQDTNTHANITGVPYYYLEDGSENEEQRGVMTKICRELASKASRIVEIYPKQ